MISAKQLGVHVFGPTSSPSCSNYALKRTAGDSKESYPSGVAETIQRKFYVDDLLKSVSDVATAIRLLNDVIEMCAAGGFRLTKIISNRIEVLQSIAETERRNGVKNVDLVLGLVYQLRRHWESIGILKTINCLSR